jgi:hypothetical protein
LKGRSKTMGYTRSQSATEKQVPAKGTKPRRIDPNDGRFTSSLHQNWLTDCSRVRCLDDGAATTNPATEIGHLNSARSPSAQ